MTGRPELVIGRPFARFTEGFRTDLRAFALEASAESLADSVAPAAPIRFHVPGGGGLGTMGESFAGPSGLLAGWREFLEPYEHFSAEIAETRTAPDGRILQLSTCVGRLEGSTTPIEVPTAAIYRIEGERVAGIDFYLDQQQARQDCGL